MNDCAGVRLWAGLLICCLLTMNASSVQAAPPVIAGFERMGRTDAAAGQLLLGELNCLSCHRSTDTAATTKQAPVLDGVGARIRPSYFKTFLADPQKVKPGSAMPHVFANDPEASVKIDALTHFLASTGGLKQESGDRKAATAGRETYHKIGCVACHGTRDDKGLAEKTLPVSVPLGDLKAKYSVGSLAAFLANPHAARPSGRMPQLLIVGDAKEKARDAKDLANYLIQGAPAIVAGKGSTAYRYYQGSWDSLPDFAKLTPASTGVGAAFDIGVGRRRSNYAMQFTGAFRVPNDGKYTFTAASDDGSRITIDGKVVVDNDGIHPTQEKSATVGLKKGVHAVAVDFFQGGGEESLTIEVEGPGLARQPLGGLVAATEADLDKVAPKSASSEPVAKDTGDAFEIKPELVEKGKAVFASEGCANCHQMKGVTADPKASPLAKLTGTGGCLADAPMKGIPWFGLSGPQKTALAAAIKTPVADAKDPAKDIATAMLTFNCYACHSRDKVGGPDDLLNKSFSTTQEAMGDEARIPPLLDNVGGKLNLDYLQKILVNGSHDRPYMNTRMPAFGQAAIANLPTALAVVDAGKFPPSPPVTFTETAGKIKGIGRHMVGAQAFGCIKCHTFAGNKAEGVQGMDMTLFPQRLQHDWFYNYMLDPQKIRPGTRMPSVYEKGKSILPAILDGTAATQTEAMWLYLKDGKGAQLPEGVKKQAIPLVPVKDAIVYRNFIQGGGPRAIGVGFPEKINLAFDANDMRLALIWQGSFMDAGRHWTGRGEGFEAPLGDNVVSLANGTSFAVLASADEAWPKGPAKSQGLKFGGYQLTADERPTFLYSLGDIKVEDFPNAFIAGKDHGLRRTLNLTTDKEAGNLYYRAAVGNKIDSLGNGVYQVDGSVRLKLTSQASPVIRSSGGRMELIVPVPFTNGKSRIVQEYAW